jgi:hypothetical protein
MVLATPLRFTRALWSAALLALSSACSVVNNDHCGNNDGDATCRLRDPARPHCSVCVADNNGCLAAPPTADCLAHTTAATTSAPTSTVDPPTSTTTSGPDATTLASTGAPDTSSTSTSDPGTSTSTTSTTSTTDTSSTSDTTAGTTMSGPVCGDNKAEGDEVCDTKDFKDKTCETVGPGKWGGGSLICNECLSLDDSDCCVGLNGTCGVLGPDPKLPCCGGGLACKFDGLNLFTCKN